MVLVLIAIKWVMWPGSAHWAKEASEEAEAKVEAVGTEVVMAENITIRRRGSCETYPLTNENLFTLHGFCFHLLLDLTYTC